MKRIITKIGDVFSVKIDEHNKKYMQLIAFDLIQLNSDVIRSFKRVYPGNINPDLSEIVKNEVEFYAHCVTKFGIKMGLWDKVGNTVDIGEIGHILFRDSDDYGNPKMVVPQNWYIWKIGDKNFTTVGKLDRETEKAEIGLIINPESIVYRMKTGKYDGFYRDF